MDMAMVKYEIEGQAMVSREKAHDELARALCLPAHYGRNLDALWDCLGDMQGEIILHRSEEMLEQLGPYGKKILAVLSEAALRVPGLTFRAE